MEGGGVPAGNFDILASLRNFRVFSLVRGGDVDVALADNSLTTALRGNGNSVVTA